MKSAAPDNAAESMFDDNQSAKLLSVLQNSEEILERKRALVGFDGYIDRLVRLRKNQNVPPDFFNSVGEFTGFITNYANQSADINVKKIEDKIGGNGPILAGALARKGVPLTCIGALGYPELEKIYEPLSGICNLISVEETGFTFILEFDDAKIMFGDSDSFYNITWERLEEIIGHSELLRLFDECDMLCFTNWSALFESNNLLEGVVRTARAFSNKPRSIFFDIADPAPKTSAQFQEFFRLLGEARESFEVILGLNPKEALIAYNHFFSTEKTAYSDRLAEKLLLEMPVDELVVHALDYAVAGGKNDALQRAPNYLVEKPAVLTGGGDNFNSGYCLGKLLGQNPELCACLGNISVNIYVATGKAPRVPDIVELIKKRGHQ